MTYHSDVICSWRTVFSIFAFVFLQVSTVVAQSASQESAINQIRNASFQRARIRYVSAFDDVVFAGWSDITGNPQLGIVRQNKIVIVTLHEKSANWLKVNVNVPSVQQPFYYHYARSELDSSGKERILEPLLDAVAGLPTAESFHLWTDVDSTVPFDGKVLGIDPGGKRGRIIEVVTARTATVASNQPFASDTMILQKLAVCAEFLGSGATHISFGTRGVAGVWPSQKIELRLNSEYQKFSDLVKTIDPSRVAANGALVYSPTPTGFPASSDLQPGSINGNGIAELLANGLQEIEMNEPLKQDPLIWFLR